MVSWNRLEFSLVPGWFFVAGEYRSKRYNTEEEAREHGIEELLVLAVQLYCRSGSATIIEVKDEGCVGPGRVMKMQFPESVKGED